MNEDVTNQGCSRQPNLIVMLTLNDLTVENAEEVFEQCRDSKALYWGMKEAPLPLDRLKTLYRRMKECGKVTVMEVVCYDEASGLQGARVAADCGVDILMGTKFFPSIAALCREKGIKYMPFAGEIEGRPSVLSGSIESIVEEACSNVEAGAWGIDILGYRYTGDAVRLNCELVKGCPARVCIAGSIDSFERLDEVKKSGAWAFTIGSAFFHNKFSGTIAEQIDKVVDYVSNEHP